MRAFVVGAAGAVGKPLVRRLWPGATEVFASTRHADRAGQLHSFGATTVQFDGLDGAAVRQAVARVGRRDQVRRVGAEAGQHRAERQLGGVQGTTEAFSRSD